MVAAIYSNRFFTVRDQGVTSSTRSQHNGICQGCPLSPFLFVIVMTTLLHDARSEFQRRSGQQLRPTDFVRELLYADYTLLFDADAAKLQVMMECVSACGLHYGLSLNWSKLEALCVRGSVALKTPDGKNVVTKGGLVYLGCLLSSDGRSEPELNRRLGAARSEFCTLQAIWSHSVLTREQKLRIFNACVVSRLLYCVLTMHLNTAGRQRVDAFQAWCLRRICRVPPSYYSRVSNLTVLNMCQQRPLSEQVLKQQMLYMGKLARRNSEDPVRSHIFEPYSCDLQTPKGTLRRGRPRQCWGQMVYKNCLQIAGTHAQLQFYFRSCGRSAAAWKRAVNAWHM